MNATSSSWKLIFGLGNETNTVSGNSQFANIDVGNVIFTHVRRIVKRFRDIGSVTKGKSSGRKPVLNEEIVEDIQQRMETSPNKSLRQLSAQTGNVYYLF